MYNVGISVVVEAVQDESVYHLPKAPCCDPIPRSSLLTPHTRIRAHTHGQKDRQTGDGTGGGLQGINEVLQHVLFHILTKHSILFSQKKVILY